MTIAHLLKLEARGYMLPERDAGRLRETPAAFASSAANCGPMPCGWR